MEELLEENIIGTMIDFDYNTKKYIIMTEEFIAKWSAEEMQAYGMNERLKKGNNKLYITHRNIHCPKEYPFDK